MLRPVTQQHFWLDLRDIRFVGNIRNCKREYMRIRFDLGWRTLWRLTYLYVVPPQL